MNEKGRCIIFMLIFIALYPFVFNGTSHARSTWLIYDDGQTATGYDVKYMGVRFSLPSGVQEASLSGVSFYISGPGNPNLHITEDDHSTEVPNSPVSVDVLSGGWIYADLSGNTINVPQNFYVIIEKGDDDGFPVSDAYDGVGRSFWGESLSGLTYTLGADALIRSKVVLPSLSPGVPLLLLEE